MSYVPVFPIGGYAGWSFLKRTMDQQTKAFNAQPSLNRDEAYFREKIGSIDTAEKLVNDPRLLRIALSAFSLEGDVGNKYFIRKILESGTLKPDSLANKLSNKQYQKFSAAFGFGNFATPNTKISDFADKIIGSYKNQQFSIAVGTQNEDMRLALNAERELPGLAKSSASSTSKWYSVLGNPPLRAVFERAFGLPKSFGAINIDKQVETLRARTADVFGSGDLEQFKEADLLEKLVRKFLVQAEVRGSRESISPGQSALILLHQNTVYTRR